MRPVYRDGKVHVQSAMCSSCIFRPGNLMQLGPGRVKGMVDDCLAEEGGNIPCHQTLGGEQAICRGFWDAYADRSLLLRMAVALGAVQEVSTRHPRTG